MKYNVKRTYTDPFIWEGRTLGEIARITGEDKSYLSKLKSGKQIASEQFYKKIKEILWNKTFVKKE